LEECKPEALRGWEWRYLKRLCRDRGLLTFDGRLGSGPVNSLEYTQDGIPVAWDFRDGTIKLLEATTETEICTIPESLENNDFIFTVSRTQNSIAFARN